ncbi:MAG: DUF4082 domain-containing protein [Dehalococcoidia bacterium]
MRTTNDQHTRSRQGRGLATTLPLGSGRTRLFWVLLLAAALTFITFRLMPAESAAPCDGPNANAIACENSKPGNPASEWDIPTHDMGDPNIQGYAADLSVDQGQAVQFKVKTPANNYRLDIYRLGYYGGLGARKIATVEPSAALPQNQPACLTDPWVGLVDCGNWAVSASWSVPADAVSGVYIAKLVREDGTTGVSHIIFIVRDDDGHSDLLFRTSDTTWQAYNSYGGASLYRDFAFNLPERRAFKVSYNRPINTRSDIDALGQRSYFFNAEYPMLRWLERNGYNVSYFSGVDTARFGAEILEHDALLSTGHDEYWSGEERTNVEAARDAGVNLAFFSGNEVFWKTRWESSTDGANTPYDTLVTYKETKAGAKVDPSPQWTGTWRDPRFSPPSDGGRPENELTGTIFTVNGPRADTMTISGEFGDLRFWRNTDIANLPPNATSTLTPGALGHEWDEDLDNGFRPAGLMRLSETTLHLGSHLLDYGDTYGAGDATHSLTLYRHASGALVFGAGTVQWSWGLDGTHDRGPSTPDSRMQQATVNLFADMGVQPGSLQGGLVAASASTDVSPPTAAITWPANGAVIESAGPVTITGTAADAGGGIVAGVEVSLDGGNTWHPAEGREGWSYTWAPTIIGQVTLMTRAVDDSGNVGAPSAGLTVQVDRATITFDDLTLAPRPLDGVYPAAVADWGTGGWYLAGIYGEFDSNSVGFNGFGLTDGTISFTTPARVISIEAYNGGTSASTITISCAGNPGVATMLDPDELETIFTDWTVVCDAVTIESTNGWDTNFDNIAYDYAGAGSDVTAPVISAVAAANVGATKTTINWTTDEPSNSQVEYGTTTAYSSLTALNTLPVTGHSVQLTGLTPGTLYNFRVKSRDPAGNLAVSGNFTFTTSSTPTCPCTIWDISVTPAVPSHPDNQPWELGVKFTSDLNGYATGVRFYKGLSNTGTHSVNLWSSSGTLLATTTSSNETTSGWQEALFPAPVAIAAGTTYIASYHMEHGGFSLNDGYFSLGGADSWPLHAPASPVAGGNGVYRYGASGFPNQSYNGSNYWVDPVFHTQPVDPVPPSVTGRSPATSATNVSPVASVTASFSEPVSSASISFQLRDDTNALVPAALTYDASTRIATLNPTAPLATTETYTATVSGATDAAGNAMSPVSWSFSTPTCPCSIWPASTTPQVASVADTNPWELGVKFTSDLDGFVTGIRFYKGPANTGTHTGSLWSATGTLLATGTFANETATGWQQLSFTAPVAVTAGTTYVASYHLDNGGFAVDAAYFAGAPTQGTLLRALSDSEAGGNGVYKFGAAGFPNQSYNASNYWVDVTFDTTAPDLLPPTLLGRSPASDATKVDVLSTVTATFSEDVVPGSISFVLRDGSNAVVPSNVGYNAGTRTATLTPNAALALSNTFTATLTGAADLAGNVVAPTSWSFSTATCPCTIWDSSATPAVASVGDSNAWEMGVKFRSQANGYITGIRFYKGPGNTGVHTGNLWSNGGGLLATATFSNETPTGWQQVNFASPVAVTAGTTYVASYHMTNGGFSWNEFYFSATGLLSSPLRALRDGEDGGNGVYRFGSSGFPDQSYHAANYWVDVVFSPTP